jgi:hypothetical protein
MSKQSPGSNFGALIQEHRKAKVADTQVPGSTQESESLQTPKILAKSQDPNYVKLTAYVPRELHMNLKLLLTSRGREISHLMTELITDYLQKER